MNKIVEYLGENIVVTEEVYTCLMELERKKSNQGRQLRRHELLWDGGLLEGMDGARNKALMQESIEEHMVKEELYHALWTALNALDSMERSLMVDKYIHGFTYARLSQKYNLPTSTLDSRLKKIKARLKVSLKKYK